MGFPKLKNKSKALRKLYRFIHQDFFQGKSTLVDRGIFFFFTGVNTLGKLLSPKRFQSWVYARIMDYLFQPLSIFEQDVSLTGTEEEEGARIRPETPGIARQVVEGVGQEVAVADQRTELNGGAAVGEAI